jgi:hypothetical protein
MRTKSAAGAATMAVVALCIVLLAAGAALAQQQGGNVEQALSPFEQFMRGLVQWLLGPGKLLIALAWLVVGFKVVLGMERAGAGGFIFVALVGLAIVYAPNILSMLGIDVSRYVQ